MKTFLSLLRKSFGWALLVWMTIFLLWNAAVGYYFEELMVVQEENASALLALDLIGIALKIWFMGYLFLVSVRTMQGVQKPLYPINFKSSFVAGLRFFLRLILINIPLVLAFYVAYYTGIQSSRFMTIFVACYLLLIAIPFILLMVKEFEKMPIFGKLWNFLKKNINTCFGYSFLAAFSYLVWFYFSMGILELAKQYSTSMSWLIFFTLVSYVSLFYMLAFVAVLAGHFVRRINEKQAVVADKEAKTEVEVEKKALVAPKKVSASRRKKVVKR